MIAIGIDIGLTGAIGFVDSKGTCVVEDMPTVPDGEKRRIDGRGLVEAIRRNCPAGEPVIVVIEDVRPRPQGNGGAHGNSMHSQGSLMRSRGAVEAALDILRLTPRPIQPQAWKRAFGLIGKKKRESLETARRLYPAAPLTRMKDHNRAEALLIAHHGLSRYA